MALNLTLYPGFIAIQRTDAPMSAGGLHLPNAGNDPTAPKYGRVIAVGPARVSESGHAFGPSCEVGDLLLLNGQPGTEQKINGDSFWFIREGDVYGVVQEATPE